MNTHQASQRTSFQKQNILHQNLSRRQLIRTGFIGSAVLTGTSSLVMLTGCAQNPTHSPLNGIASSPYAFLTKDDINLASALIPAVVGAHWPTNEYDQQQAAAKTLMRIDTFISRLGSFNMSEMRKLFDLLEFRLSRVITTGIWSNWENISTAEATEFLQSWKTSRFSVLRGGYNALTDILGFAWYSNPENTAAFGYAGPPQHALESLPQFKNLQANFNDSQTNFSNDQAGEA